MLEGDAATVRTGVRLEHVTLGWNVIGIAVLTLAALSAHSVALAGFALDSLIEIGASIIVLGELHGSAPSRGALRGIGAAFAALGAWLTVQSSVVLITGYRAHVSAAGIAWTAATVLVMSALAAGKQRTGTRLGNAVLVAEARVTRLDAVLAASVLVGLALNAAVGAWWADPVAGLLVAAYAIREALTHGQA